MLRKCRERTVPEPEFKLDLKDAEKRLRAAIPGLKKHIESLERARRIRPEILHFRFDV